MKPLVTLILLVGIYFFWDFRAKERQRDLLQSIEESSRKRVEEQKLSSEKRAKEHAKILAEHAQVVKWREQREEREALAKQRDIINRSMDRFSNTNTRLLLEGLGRQGKVRYHFEDVTDGSGAGADSDLEAPVYRRKSLREARATKGASALIDEVLRQRAKLTGETKEAAANVIRAKVDELLLHDKRVFAYWHWSSEAAFVLGDRKSFSIGFARMTQLGLASNTRRDVWSLIWKAVKRGWLPVHRIELVDEQTRIKVGEVICSSDGNSSDTATQIVAQDYTIKSSDGASVKTVFVSQSELTFGMWRKEGFQGIIRSYGTGSVTFAGFVKNGRQVGRGILAVPGRLEVGEFQDFRLSGKGCVRSANITSSGFYSEGELVEGTRKMDGAVWRGVFKNSLLSSGAFYASNGVYVSGVFHKNGMRGVKVSSSGGVLVGEVQDAKPTQNAVYKDADGKIYVPVGNGSKSRISFVAHDGSGYTFFAKDDTN